MIILTVLFWVIISLVILLVLLYFLEPSLIALPYSRLLAVFLKNDPIVDMESNFPGHKILKDNVHVIQKELENVLANKSNIPKFHDVDKIQTYISNKGDAAWRVFMFKAYDNWVESNCAMAPETTKLLKQVPQVTTAMFSILDGKKQIPPHIGFYKGVLRYHLALKVPKQGECYIIDGGERYDWVEGEDVLFDDTFRHEVWNKSDEVRVVLFCDVLRERDIPSFMKGINSWVYQLREKSKRLKKVTRNAEVPQAIT